MVRVNPRHDKQSIPLVDDPADQTVLWFQIEDIEFIDPWREHHNRGFIHRFCGWRVLDQLHHLVAINNLARRGRNISTHLKGSFIHQTHHQFAVVGLEIFDEVLHTIDQGLSLGLKRFFQGIRIGRQKIGR